MGLVKAKMAFYHDAVGTRAHNEVFEVGSEQTCAELEQAGYVEKVSGVSIRVPGGSRTQRRFVAASDQSLCVGSNASRSGETCLAATSSKIPVSER